MGQKAAGSELLLKILARTIGELIFDAGAEIHIFSTRGGLGDADAGLGQLRTHVAAAVHDPVLRHELLHNFLVAEAVLQCGYNGLGPDAAHCALERKLGYRSLDHQDDYISNADLLGGIGGLKAGDVELAVGIAKDHAVPGHLGQRQHERRRGPA